MNTSVVTSKDPMHLVISTSLNPKSRSRILATAAVTAIKKNQQQCELLDLASMELPNCDGDQCYGHPDVVKLATAISSASSILIASPIYNYDVSASCKNMIELTGKAWTDKVVGFLVAAGGASSYMGVMGLANSLMLDFRCLIAPRFVYSTGQAFAGDQIAEEDVLVRIDELAKKMIQLSNNC